MVDDMGVGRAAAEAAHTGIILGRVTVHREQQFAGIVLRHPALVAHIAGLVMHLPILETEHADMAFTIEGNIALTQGKLGVGTNPVKSTTEARRNLTFDFAITHVNFSLE